MQIISSKIRNAIYNIGEKIYIHELTRKWGLFRGKKKKNLKNNQFPILVMWETKDQPKSLMPWRSLLGELGLYSGWGRLEIKPCPKDQKLPWCKYLQNPSCLKVKYGKLCLLDKEERGRYVDLLHFSVQYWKPCQSSQAIKRNGLRI